MEVHRTFNDSKTVSSH